MSTASFVAARLRLIALFRLFTLWQLALSSLTHLAALITRFELSESNALSRGSRKSALNAVPEAFPSPLPPALSARNVVTCPMTAPPDSYLYPRIAAISGKKPNFRPPLGRTRKQEKESGRPPRGLPAVVSRLSPNRSRPPHCPPRRIFFRPPRLPTAIRSGRTPTTSRAFFVS